MQSKVSKMALGLKVPATKCVDFSLIMGSYTVEAENLLLQVPLWPPNPCCAVSLPQPANCNNFFKCKMCQTHVLREY